MLTTIAFLESALRKMGESYDSRFVERGLFNHNQDSNVDVSSLARFINPATLNRPFLLSLLSIKMLPKKTIVDRGLTLPDFQIHGKNKNSIG
ncbi:MAG: hypothetical protein AAGU11_14220, partial [Syntrophobacteraceae bacterium]